MPKKLRDPPNSVSIEKNLKHALEQYKENADANWEFKDTERMFRASEERTNKKLAETQKQLAELAEKQQKILDMLESSSEKPKKGFFSG